MDYFTFRFLLVVGQVTIIEDKFRFVYKLCSQSQLFHFLQEQLL